MSRTLSMASNLHRHNREVHNTYVLCAVNLQASISSSLKPWFLMQTFKVESTTPPSTLGSIEHELVVSDVHGMSKLQPQLLPYTYGRLY